MSNTIVKTVQATVPSGAGRPRLAFVDNVRWTVIAMVVLIHACVTYSGLGSWYYKEGTSLDVVSMIVFAFYEIFAQGFFMGLLFFVAASFTPGAYDRKGFGRFILDRAFRLGIPTLFYMFVIHPITVFVREAGTGHGLSLQAAMRWYGDLVTSGAFLRESGPLWFALALLVFSVVYALIRLVADAVRAGRPRSASPVPPSSTLVHRAAVILIAVIALGTIGVRMVQPLGTSWYNMQLGYFTQYVVLFVVGLWAGRSGLLTSFPRQAGKVWMRLGLAIGIPVWFLMMGLGGATAGNLTPYMGGLQWQAIVLAAWEAFICVSFSVGLLSLFRERVNTRNVVTGTLADTSFGIYVFHAPVLVGVSMLMRTVMAYPLAKALLAGVAAWVVSLAIAFLVRRIPGVGKVFA